MTRARRSFVLWISTSAVLAGCASVPLPPGEGAELYRAKCGGCHRLYAPSEIKDEGWPKRIELMSSRAKLTQLESARIRRYLESNRTPSPRPPG
jgi:hypothetical protein